MSWKGDDVSHCERTDEDPKFYAREPQLEDTSAEDRAVEAEPDYFAEQVAIARQRAEDVYCSPGSRNYRELLSCIDVIERLHRESLR